jgi:hypothetical protein
VTELSRKPATPAGLLVVSVSCTTGGADMTLKRTLNRLEEHGLKFSGPG